MAGAHGVELRFMTAADVETVAALDGATFSTGWSASSYARELANPTARYLVLAGGPGRDDVLGFGGLWVIVDQAHIVTVTIRAEVRGEGLGALLVHGLMTLAATCEVVDVTLEVRASNAVARNLYRSYGFVEVGRRERYYEDREDAVIMTTEAVTSPGYARRLLRRRESLDARFPRVLGAFEASLGGMAAGQTSP